MKNGIRRRYTRRVWIPLMLVVSLLGLQADVAYAANITFNSLPGAGSIFVSLNNVVRWMMYASLAVLPIVIVIGGYYFVTSGGDPNRVATARKIITWGLIGFFVIIMAQALTKIVISIFS